MKGSIDMTYRQPTTIRLLRAAQPHPQRVARAYPWVIGGVLLAHVAVFAGMTQLQPKLITPPPPKPVQIRLVELAPPPPPPKVVPEPAASRVPEAIKPKVVPVTPPPPAAKTPPPVMPTAAPVAKPVAKPITKPVERTVEAVVAPVAVVSTPVQQPTPVTPVVAPVTPPAVPQPVASTQPVQPPAPSSNPSPRTVAIDGVAYKRPPQVEYPEQAMRRGETGTVLVRALINIKGQVDTASIDTSSGHRSLDQAAVRAVKRASFHAYRENGITQSVYVLIPIAFTPTEE